MNLEKQIEEMAKVIQYGEIARNRGDLDCTEFPTDLVIKVGLQRLAGAKALYNYGYRKDTDVAREIFDELEYLARQMSSPITIAALFETQQYKEFKNKHMGYNNEIRTEN